MKPVRDMRERLKFKLIVAAFFFLMAATACSTSRESGNLAYEGNPFWTYDPSPPRHEGKKAHVDFFDKVCNGGKGQGYDCHYTDE